MWCTVLYYGVVVSFLVYWTDVSDVIGRGYRAVPKSRLSMICHVTEGQGVGLSMFAGSLEVKSQPASRNVLSRKTTFLQRSAIVSRMPVAMVSAHGY